ncbi:MAG: hypothetical protein AB8G05_22250 [Oligoflexales bacterium]
MRWCIVFGLFVLTSCGGSSGKKSSAAKVSNDASNTSSSGASAEFVTVNVELFDNTDLSSYVADVASKMNAYQVSFIAKDEDCDEGDQVITGDLNESFSLEVDISRNCIFDVFLSYGYAPDAEGAAPATDGTAGADGSSSDDDGSTDGTSGGAALVSYEGDGGAKEYLDQNCATSGCHAAASISPDLSSFDAITGDNNSITDSIGRMGSAGAIMPPGGSPAANADAISLLQGWVDNDYAQGGAALALTDVSFQTAYYESEPIALTKNIMDSHDLLTLKFKLCRTTEGQAAGFSDAAVECIQGGSYKRAGSGNDTTGGNTDGSTDGGSTDVDGGDADGGDADGGDVDGGDPNDIVGDPNSTLTFADVQDLFITNPAAAVEGCTAAGCHGAEAKGVNASSDYSSYENIVAAESSSSGSILLYLKMDLMPKTTPYGLEDKQKIADWIAAGMAAAPVVAPDPNAVVTSEQVLALLGVGLGNCAQAGCHAANNAARMDLSTVDAIKLQPNVWIARLNNATMPLLNGGDAANTRLLEAAEIAMIQEWIANGTPDAADVVP